MGKFRFSCIFFQHCCLLGGLGILAVSDGGCVGKDLLQAQRQDLRPGNHGVPVHSRCAGSLDTGKFVLTIDRGSCD